MPRCEVNAPHTHTLNPGPLWRACAWCPCGTPTHLTALLLPLHCTGDSRHGTQLQRELAQDSQLDPNSRGALDASVAPLLPLPVVVSLRHVAQKLQGRQSMPSSRLCCFARQSGNSQTLRHAHNTAALVVMCAAHLLPQARNDHVRSNFDCTADDAAATAMSSKWQILLLSHMNSRMISMRSAAQPAGQMPGTANQLHQKAASPAAHSPPGSPKDLPHVAGERPPELWWGKGRGWTVPLASFQMQLPATSGLSMQGKLSVTASQLDVGIEFGRHPLTAYCTMHRSSLSLLQCIANEPHKLL